MKDAKGDIISLRDELETARIESEEKDILLSKARTKHYEMELQVVTLKKLNADLRYDCAEATKEIMVSINVQVCYSYFA